MSRSERQDTPGRTAWEGPTRIQASAAPHGQSENGHDIILVPSSPDLLPMPALSSMPPPATTTPHAPAAKFSLNDLSFSSSPILPSRIVKPITDDGVDKQLPTLPARDYVTLDSTPNSDARTMPPPGASRSVYFPDNGNSSSPNTEGSKVNSGSVHPVTVTDVDTPTPRPERYESGDLVQAVERRRDWTPPPTDTAALQGTSPSLLENWSSPSAGVPGSIPARADAFKTLHSRFSCKDVAVSERNSTESTVTTTTALGSTAEPTEPVFARRMPIEAVSIGGGNDSNKSPTKAAPKKKPRTITELAMAAYADSPWDEEEVEPAKPEKAAPKRRGRPKRQLELVEENSNEPLPTQPAVVQPGFPTTKLRKLQSAAAVSITADGKKVKKPRKKPAPRTKKPVVLSPESARTESMQQNFLFGTSSQLAADESPTFLRQLHVAMQESNGLLDDEVEEGRNSLLELLEDSSEVDLTAAATVGASGVHTFAAARGGSKTKLWGAAWRGEDGQVTYEHVIDLEDSEVAAFPDDPHQVLAKMQSQTQSEQHDKEEEAGDIRIAGAAGSNTAKAANVGKSKSSAVSPTLPTQPVSSSLPLKPTAGARKKVLTATQPPPSHSTPSSVRGTAAADTTANTSRVVSSELPTPTPMPCAVSSAVPPPIASPPAPPTPPTPPDAPAHAPAPVSLPKRPNFDVLTTAQLSKKVSSYGYKAMKVRSAMVALLNQCWDAKNGISSGAVSVQAASISTTSAASAPASPRGKAKKASSDAVSPKRVTKPTTKARAKKAAPAAEPPKPLARIVYEIEDSEASDDGRFSSPEVPCSVASDASLAYDSEGVPSDCEAVGELDDAMDDAMDETLAAEPTSEETRLFRLMTEAVTSAPSSSDPTQPSWHEKMLMYDTIILEEFTEWLNSAVGVDTEITALQAKKWCESKSVCCTWRKNTRGKERKL